MDTKENSYFGATSNDLIASAFFAHSTDILVKAGEALGMDMTSYRKLYCNILKTFREYFMENGLPKEELPLTEVSFDNRASTDKHRKGITQTSLSLILHFELCEQKDRPQLAARIAQLIEENGTRMNTGFVGTPYLLHALSENGYTDIAYRLLMQEKAPSWLYSVCHGATTMWEHWDSIKEDGTFWSTAMNSFNHYAYGAVFDWIFGVACGISPIESGAGYRKVRIAPHPDKSLGFADTSIDTRNGKIRAYWYYKNDRVYYEFELPVGVEAELRLPSGYSAALTEGVYHFSESLQIPAHK